MASHAGDLAVTFDALGLAATGTSPSVVGTLSATLGALALSATGDSPAAGDESSVLGALTLHGQGSAGPATTVYYFHPRHTRPHRERGWRP